MTTSELQQVFRQDAARQSGGRSAEPILEMVARIVRASGLRPGRLLDVGAGSGALYSALRGQFTRYSGCDLIQYAGFPVGNDIEFRTADLNQSVPFETGCADLVVSVETIEHLENPRAFLRELVRVAAPDALLIVTTPNQLSFLSKLCFALKNRHVAFQDVDYPAHITPLLESDLLHIATEVGLSDLKVEYSEHGRIPGTSWSWPRLLGGRIFSDNLALVARHRGSTGSKGTPARTGE